MYEIFNSLLMKTNKKPSDVAKATGISPATLSDWKSGKSRPKQDKLKKIADYFGVTLEYLMTGDYDIPSSGKGGVKVPILGKVAAGIPIEEIEDIIGWEEIPESMARKGKYFCLEIKGDSMYPDLRDGDIIVVRYQNTADNGDVVIAQVNGNEATCKRLAISQTGITLMPYNPKYEPMSFTNEEIENLPVTIIGKVVESRRKF